MDNLKSLIEKKQFDLVIKITENSTEPTDIFYRISALLASGRPLEALKTIETNQKKLQSNLFVLAKIHIEILCLLEKFDEAYDVLKYYEELPYESQQVEELLRALPKYIRDEEKKANQSLNPSQDKIIKLLMSKDNNEVLLGLGYLKDLDITPYLIYLNKIMVSSSKQSIRTYALLLLVNKKYDKEVSFKSIDQTIKVIPSQLVPPFLGKDFDEIIKNISTYSKDSSLNENVIELYSTILLYFYPNKPCDDTNLLIKTLFKIGEAYMGGESPNEEDLSKEEKELLDKVNYALTNF